MIGNDWADHGLVQDSKRLLDQAKKDRQWADLSETIVHAALRVEQGIAAYDAGFEAGVLASEAGLGRAADA